jgi:hypothetical protein
MSFPIGTNGRKSRMIFPIGTTLLDHTRIHPLRKMPRWSRADPVNVRAVGAVCRAFASRFKPADHAVGFAPEEVRMLLVHVGDARPGGYRS